MPGERIAIFDACVLVQAPLRDTLLRLAEPPALYQPRWSDEIIAEMKRALETKDVHPGNTLDVIADHGVAISHIQPGNIEVTSGNASMLGYERSTFNPDPADPILSPFLLPGLHTLIKLPSTAPAGTYTVKANASQTTVESGMMVTYNSDSSPQAGLSSKAPTYRVGETAVLTALLFDNTTPLTGVAASAKLMAEVDVTTQATVQKVQMLTSIPAGTGWVREVYTARLLSGPALTRVPSMTAMLAGASPLVPQLPH